MVPEAFWIEYMEAHWFKLTDVHRLREGDGLWKDESRPPDSHLLIAVAGGQGQLSIDGAVQALAPEEVWICGPGQRVALNAAAFGNKGIYLLTFRTGPAVAPGAASLKKADAPGGWPEAGAALAADAAVFQLCGAIAEYWRDEDRLQRLRSQAAFHELLCAVVRAQKAASTGSLKAMLEIAKAYIEEHYREPLSLEKLAVEAGISSRHFRRLFRGLYGKSPVDYIGELRMNQARQLMQSDVPLWQVAQEVGYGDESHFRRAFKSHTGLSPALYLKNNQLRIAAYSWPNIGMLLPLRIIPYAAPIDHFWTDYYRSKYSFDVKVRLKHDYVFNRKALSAAKPDRIIAIDEFMPPLEQEIVSQIAPVLFVPWKSADWRQHLRMTAGFLERSREAEEWLARFDRDRELIADRTERLARRERLLVLMIDRKRMYRWSAGLAVGEDASDLPLAPARHLDEYDSRYEPIEVRQAAEANAERIWMLLAEDGVSQATWKAASQSPEWQRMGAVQAGRVHLVRIGPWYEYSAFNHGLIQQQVLDLLDSLRD